MTERKERDIQRAIKDWLTVQGYKVYRINNGAVFNPKRKCYVFHGTPGVPDLWVVGHGIAAWVEVKSDKGRQSPDQKAFQDSLVGTRVSYILARSIDDVQRELSLLTGEVFSTEKEGA